MHEQSDAYIRVTLYSWTWTFAASKFRRVHNVERIENTGRNFGYTSVARTEGFVMLQSEYSFTFYLMDSSDFALARGQNLAIILVRTIGIFTRSFK